MTVETSSESSTLPSTPAIPKPSTASRINRWFESHWLLAFNTGWGIFIGLPWLAPVFMAIGWTYPGRAIYFIYNFFCHQLPERSWFLFGEKFSYTQVEIAAVWGRPLESISNELVRRHFIGEVGMGWKVAWSDRMVAMYTSIFIFGLLYAFIRQRGIRFKGISIWMFFLFIVPLGLDGTTHLINDALRLQFRQTNEWAVILTGGIFPPEFYIDDLFGSLNSVLRIISGILFGYGVVAFMWPLMDNEFSPTRTD